MTSRRATHACAVRLGTSIVLNRPSPPFRPDSIGNLTLAGAIIAYTDSTRGVDAGSTDLIVVDVSRRRTLLTVSRAGSFVDACVMGFSDVTDLVVTPRGSVAWTVRKGRQCKEIATAVYSAQPHGTPVLLEEASDILATSLRLSGQRVSWENAGQRKSAPLS